LYQTELERKTWPVSSEERELRIAWQRHISPSADEGFDSVVSRHREPHRRYHDLRHVRWVVRHACELAPRFELPADAVDEIVAAAFFHDAIYDPVKSDNESASARHATAVLAELEWPAPAIARVAEMIAATAGHVDTDDLATAVLLAADLGVLAAEPSRYIEYATAVRHEYGHLDDEVWAAGRATFIRTLLERERIFPTILDLDDWERRARANLTAELAALS
jgi:predicted metal-dependent HD superfamily phosphohydrolase